MSKKVRLMAKKGRYQETAATNRMRTALNHFRNPGNEFEFIVQQGVKGRSEAAARAGIAKQQEAAANELLNGEGLSDYYIEFDATPEVTESGSASYFEASDIRAPGSVVVYMGSPSRNFTINAKLIARDMAEAQRVFKQIHVLKSWRMPESYTGGFNAGTPAVLYLDGYGSMFKQIPVVMTDLSIEFPSEFDYIQNGEMIVPIITSVSISLKEAHASEKNIDGMEGFDILQYRTGTLKGW